MVLRSLMAVVLAALSACGPAPTASERQAETDERMALANALRTATVARIGKRRPHFSVWPWRTP